MKREKLRELADNVVHEITEVDKSVMGFTLDEVNKINVALWQYECALHTYAADHSSEQALRFHYELPEKKQKQVRRAFVMMGRKPESCVEVKDAH